jgi:hypothetical protein
MASISAKLNTTQQHVRYWNVVCRNKTVHGSSTCATGQRAGGILVGGGVLFGGDLVS